MADGQKMTAHENAIGWIIMGVVLIVIAFLIWINFEFQIKNAIRWLRIGEAQLISFFVPDDFTITIDGQKIPYKQTIEDMKRVRSENIDNGLIGLMSQIALLPLKYIIAFLLFIGALWSYKNGPGTQYRRKLTLDTIIQAQANNFQSITPFIKFNPSSMPPRAPGAPVPAELPLFAEALGPEEWIAYNQIPMPNGQLDEEATFKAFLKQLGGRWKGPMKLAPHKQILLACFCLKASRKRKESDEMLGRIAKCWSHDKGLQLSLDKKLLKDAHAVLRNKDLAKNVLMKCNQHAFETSALLKALQTARDEGGVLAPAQFVWLRGHDRALWYPLNNLGRQAFHMEALGAISHFKIERRTTRPIPKPQLSDAIQSITEYMSSGRARPVPQLDYSKTKKRGIKKPKNAGIKKPTSKKQKPKKTQKA